MNPGMGHPGEAARRRAEAILRGYAWPTELLSVLGRLKAQGEQAFLVGGSVRDVLLGREPNGLWDVATSGTPDRVRERFARVEPIGEKLGTMLVVEADGRYEVTTFRREGEYADARHPDRVWFTREPLEDLSRRDLTVNALAFDPTTGDLLDPHEGALDLEARCLRAVGDAAARFREDALRPLRVARFAAVLGMTVEDGTRAALGTARDRSPGLAVERVRVELELLLAAPRPSDGLELLREARLLELWLPELVACHGVPQNRFHAHDVYFHSLYSCDAAPAEKLWVRWAALLHDIGKPATGEIRDGEMTFYQHQFVGAVLAETLLERLRFPHRDRHRIVHLVREHMFDYRPEWGDAAVRRWLQRVGLECVADLFDLRLADYQGNGLKQGFPTYLDEFAARIERVVSARDALSVGELAVDGQDVMRILGIGPGPEVGQALTALLERVLEHPNLNTRERLMVELAGARAREDRPHA
ncbi:MAG: HD domain-containing protein [Candidatus Eisenbacteria bacterium]